MEKTKQARRCLAVLLLFLVPFVLSGCVPMLAVREVLYRPSPDDPYGLWRAYVTDSGLLLLCGKVENGLENMDRVERVYNLELRLEDSLDPQRAGEVQVVTIDDHPSLLATKGYLSDLCQFDRKRPTRRPNEEGWTKVLLDNWDEGYAEPTQSDLYGGRLPIPPAEPRLVMYKVKDSDPPQYLLMGRFQEDGPEWKVMLILGSDHIESMW